MYVYDESDFIDLGTKVQNEEEINLAEVKQMFVDKLNTLLEKLDELGIKDKESIEKVLQELR